jgi:transposase
MFVDHAGQTVPVIDRLSGDTRDAYVFVAVLGASSYTSAETAWTRGLRDWRGCSPGPRREFRTAPSRV